MPFFGYDDRLENIQPHLFEFYLFLTKFIPILNIWHADMFMYFPAAYRFKFLNEIFISLFEKLHTHTFLIKDSCYYCCSCLVPCCICNISYSDPQHRFPKVSNWILCVTWRDINTEVQSLHTILWSRMVCRRYNNLSCNNADLRNSNSLC